jgi:hypothetical protein
VVPSLGWCKRVTVLERRDGDVLALACRGVSTALSARYKSGLEARREQYELILLHPHSTVPSYAATNPLTGGPLAWEIRYLLTARSLDNN